MSDAMSTEHMVSVLNRALEADREAITELFFHQVPCNDALADDPTIVVRDYEIQINDMPIDKVPIVGALGVINGFLDDGDVIVMEVDNDTRKIVCFRTKNVETP